MNPFQVLSGIRVIDMSRIIAGPLAAQNLADFGADVIKVERPGTGDDSRGYVRGRIDCAEVSPLFVTFNTNKRSICLDINDVTDREVLSKLIGSADVVIHNFRPGVADRLGLDAKTLREGNARLIYCSVSGFGDAGPRRNDVANDIAAQAYGGRMSIVGEPDQPPLRIPIQIADVTTGYNAALGVLAALIGRAKTGEGSIVGTSLFETVLSLMGQYFTDYAVSGVAPRPVGSQNRHGLPNRAFPTMNGQPRHCLHW